MFSTAMTYCPIEKNKIRTTLSARQVSLLFIPNAESANLLQVLFLMIENMTLLR